MILFRPVGLSELRLIEASGFRAFPPRLPEQPIFYPVLTEEYARKIARDWNTLDERSGYAGFVTQFEVDDTYASRFPIQVAGGRDHEELWVPADEVPEFNHHILGKILVIEMFFGPRFVGDRASLAAAVLLDLIPPMLTYQGGSLVGGKLTRSVCPQWDWSRNGGGYDQHRDFFSVHWEIQHREPTAVRLHVEAPSRAADADLNAIKEQLLAAVLASDLSARAENGGYTCQPGTRTSIPAVQRYKSTEALRVIVPLSDAARTPEQRIQAVHDVLGRRVQAIVARFSTHLDALFDDPTEGRIEESP